MAQRSNVPKFGNWESEENIPYTAYFDKARKGKGGGRVINPNDPQESPDVLSDDKPPVQAPPFRTGVEPGVLVGQGAVRPKHERRSSREDGDPHLQHGDRGVSPGDPPKRAGRHSGGSDRSIEQSPLHPHYQARVGGRGTGSGSGGGVSSPSWEAKSSDGSHGLPSNTPGRSRLRSAARSNETPDKSASVPKFGEWDENNPSSADGYTHIFNKVREEKQSGTGMAPGISTETSNYNHHKQDNRNNSSMCCCFSWGK